MIHIDDILILLFKQICGLHPVNKIDWLICIEKQVRKILEPVGLEPASILGVSHKYV